MDETSFEAVRSARLVWLDILRWHQERPAPLVCHGHVWDRGENAGLSRAI